MIERWQRAYRMRWIFEMIRIINVQSKCNNPIFERSLRLDYNWSIQFWHWYERHIWFKIMSNFLFFPFVFSVVAMLQITQFIKQIGCVCAYDSVHWLKIFLHIQRMTIAHQDHWAQSKILAYKWILIFNKVLIMLALHINPSYHIGYIEWSPPNVRIKWNVSRSLHAFRSIKWWISHSNNQTNADPVRYYLSKGCAMLG